MYRVMLDARNWTCKGIASVQGMLWTERMDAMPHKERRGDV